MTKHQMVQRLQNCPITSWLWQLWQHEETGKVCRLGLWERPGSRWHKHKARNRHHQQEQQR